MHVRLLKLTAMDSALKIVWLNNGVIILCCSALANGCELTAYQIF